MGFFGGVWGFLEVLGFVFILFFTSTVFATNRHNTLRSSTGVLQTRLYFTGLLSFTQQGTDFSFWVRHTKDVKHTSLIVSSMLKIFNCLQLKKDDRFSYKIGFTISAPLWKSTKFLWTNEEKGKCLKLFFIVTVSCTELPGKVQWLLGEILAINTLHSVLWLLSS